MESSAMAPIQTDGLIEIFRADLLNVYIYASRQQMGAAAAATVVAEIRRLLTERGRAAGIFA